MTKLQLHKNRLDLAYHRQLQLLNAILILLTTGLLSFLAAFVWKPELLLKGFLLVIVIAFFSILSYIRVNANLRKISEEIMALK